MNVGTIIREKRIERGMEPAELAAGICTPSMIVQIEAGTAQPSSWLLDQLADRLDIPRATLQPKVNLIH